MKDRKLPFWVLVIVLTLCAVLVGVVIWQGSRLRTLQQSTPDQTAPASSVQQGTSAADTVESSARLAKSFDLTPTDVDRAGGTASADVSLELWDDLPGAAVTLLVTQGGVTSSLTLTRNDSGVYTALLTLPLSVQQGAGDQSVSLMVMVEADGTSVKERLEDYPNTRFMTASLRIDLKEGGMLEELAAEDGAEPDYERMAFLKSKRAQLNTELRGLVEKGDPQLAMENLAHGRVRHPVALPAESHRTFLRKAAGSGGRPGAGDGSSGGGSRPDGRYANSGYQAVPPLCGRAP